MDTAYMGTFTIGGGQHELAYVYGAATSPDFNGGLAGNAAILVVDLTAGKEVAFVASPAGFTPYNTYFAYITDPSGNKYPFVAPGAHYLTNSSDAAGNRYAVWNGLCIFNVPSISNPGYGCDTGFTSYLVTFTAPNGLSEADASGFRHNGGWVEDVDRDGWGDINLPFLEYILTISGRTGVQLGLAHFDVAASTEPTSPPYFHSGRFYGGFNTFTDPQTGARDVLFSDGLAVGNTDWEYNCNVSSYMAVGQWSGTKLNLKWSDYLSFAKTIFNPPYDSVSNYSRLGNDLNGCANWIGQSLSYVNGYPYVVYDRFTRDTSTPICQQETLNEQKANFTDATTQATNICFQANALPLMGHWSARVLDAGTGKEVSNTKDMYVWGVAANVVSGNSPAFLVQKIIPNGGDVQYEHTANTNGSAFAIATLGSGGALTLGATSGNPEGRVPNVLGNDDTAYGAFPMGSGSSFLGIPQLVLKDVDGDGLNDIQMNDGTWLGWSAALQKLVLKKY